MIVAVAIALLAVAAGVFFLPQSKKPQPSFVVTPAPTEPVLAAKTVSYAGAISDLANVRKRLIQTSTLADEQKKAIDILTLALVAGSDQ
jgi:hypothetical protein